MSGFLVLGGGAYYTFSNAALLVQMKSATGLARSRGRRHWEMWGADWSFIPGGGLEVHQGKPSSDNNSQ